VKLLIVTQYFPPETGAPQARLFELAKRLKGMAHEITVLTGMPNYPTGKIFDGYRFKLCKTESIEDIKVVRTCLYPSKSSKTISRLLSYLSFGLSSLFLGPWGIGKQDVVLIESPPLFLVPFALLISKIVRGKAVMMVSDIWPDIIIRMGHASEKSMAIKAMLWLEKFGYKRSYAVALTNLGAREQIRTRFPDLKYPTVISNGVDTTMFRPELRDQKVRKKYGAGPDDFLIGYCGLYGLAQGLHAVIEAAEKLKDKDNVKLIMIGDGPVKEELQELAESKRLTNLTFYDRCAKKDMPAIIASLDISLVTLSGRFPGTMPSKIYEAFASGTPPLVAKGCEGETLVNKYDTGRCYEPCDADDMAKMLKELISDRKLLNEMSSRCVELSTRFDRAVIAERTNAILTAVAEGRELPEVKW